MSESEQVVSSSVSLEDLITERDILYDICNRPYKIFTNDLLYFLCKEYGTMWVPPGHLSYSIHRSSPLNNNIRGALRLLFGGNEEAFNEKYEEITQNVGCNLVLFSHWVTKKLKKLFTSSRTVCPDIFLNIAFMGRLSVVFFQRGTKEAPTVFALLMTEQLKELYEKNPNIIHRFSRHASFIYSDTFLEQYHSRNSASGDSFV